MIIINVVPVGKKNLPFVNVTFKSVGIEELSLNHLHEQPLKD